MIVYTLIIFNGFNLQYSRGDYSMAMQHYTDGLLEDTENANEEVKIIKIPIDQVLLIFQILEHNDVCRSGIARMAIRTGDIRRLESERKGNFFKNFSA